MNLAIGPPYSQVNYYLWELSLHKLIIDLCELSLYGDFAGKYNARSH